MLEHTKQQMVALKLNGMLLALDEQLQHPPHQLSFEERFSLLVEREYLYQENQRLENRLKQAKLKSSYVFEHVDFNAARDLNKQQILSLANGAWIKQHRSIIITGPTGTGKTFLACALAHKACLLGFKARYYRLLHLVHDIVIAYRTGKLTRYLTALGKINILVIDDFGMVNLDDEQKRLLLEILEHRYESNATIITSQLPLNLWYDYLNDPLIADALLDRIVHQAEKIILSGESLRKTNAKFAEKNEVENI